VAGYRLQPGEAFVHKQSRVLHNGAYLDELVLTSQSLVLLRTVRKGLLGSEQVTQVLPLSQIKVLQGHARALPGTLQSGSPALDVYFHNGAEQFGFQSKKEATFWSQKIDEIVTGTRAKTTSPSFSGAEQVTEVIKGTVGVFKDAFGFSSRTQVAAAAAAVPVAAASAAVPVAGDCVSCGAPLSGIRGQAIMCSYCDTVNHL
jgi:LSD1 subclass zinc finger protein